MAESDGSQWRPVTRRRLLTSAAALGLAGCAPAVPRATRAAAVPTLLLTPESGAGTSEFYGRVPGLAPGFNTAHRGVAVAAGAAHPTGPVAPYHLIGVAGWLSRPRPLPLDTALARANFDARTLLPGVLQPFRGTAGLAGVPVAQWPIGVRWRTEVFSAAGLAPPAPDWTVADFEAACASISALIPARRVPGLRAVLFPMGIQPIGRTQVLEGALAAPWWWTAFALGYGGTVAAGGRFAFDAAAVDGLAVLVDIARRFGAGPETVPASAAGVAGMADQYALALDIWGNHPMGASLSASLPSLRFGKEWAWARAPRFPVRPVVTTVPGGEGLTLSGSPVPADLPLAVEALLWLYAPAAQAPLRAGGLPPVLADAGAQAAFWGMWGLSGQAVGDWSHFTPYNAAWPGPAGAAPMAEALSAAVAEPARLGALVAAAARQMSAQVQAAVAE